MCWRCRCRANTLRAPPAKRLTQSDALHSSAQQVLAAASSIGALTRPGVIRYFLQRTWGSKNIDEALWRYDLLTTRQPGAKYAPLYFLSAHLFAADITTLYEKLTCPVWVSMATRGDFTNYKGRSVVNGKPNWQFEWAEGGALPYFEDLAAFTGRLDQFLE
jgi:hypothetical protein